MTLKSPPSLSVCIPAYRGSTHLAAAIDSVLMQDFTDYELIIIDDNSPDHTAEIVSSYQDNRIRYIRNSINLGPEGNWNKCLLESKGKYFKLLPQDDILAPDCLRLQVAVLESDVNESITLVFCARHIIDSKQRIITTRGYRHCKEGIVFSRDLVKSCIHYGTNLIGEPGAVMFRKSLAKKTGFFDGSIPYIIDLDYWFRLLHHGDAYYISKPLVAFRVSSGSWSVDIGNRQKDDFKQFIGLSAQNSIYPLNFIDTLIGICMATINNYLRLLFYKLYIKNRIA